MSHGTLQLNVENVGGIEQDSVEIDPGVTVLSGENATNRTSLMKSLMAALGSNEPSIRAGVGSGEVNLTIDNETHTRTVVPTERGSKWDGDGVVDDVELLELFSFLLEQNDVRQAVANDENLYDLVMEPVDTGEIDREIANLKEKRDEIERKENELPDKKDRIVTLEQKIDGAEQERDELEAELEEVKDEIASIDEDEIQTDKIEQNKQLNEELKELQNKKQKVQDKINRKEKQLEARREELSEAKSTEFKDRDEIKDQITTIEDEMSSLKADVEQLEEDKKELTPLKRALRQLTKNDSSTENINRVAEKYSDGLVDAQTEHEGSITDILVEGASNRCVLCGNEIEEGHYESLLQEINQITNEITTQKSEKQEKMGQLNSEKETLKDKLREIRQNESRISTLKGEIEDIEADIEDEKDELVEIQDEKSNVEEKLEALEEDVVEEAEDRTEEIRQLESRKTELEMDIESYENDVERYENEIRELESEVGEIEDMVDEVKPDIEDEIEQLRGKVASIERGVVQQFNERMEEIIDRLNYKNIERIWLQQRKIEVKEGRKKVDKKVYDLNVVREIDGVTTEDTVSNLSESEREVTSMIFSLAGYLVHDVDEVFPIMLIDSVEMVDANRLEKLLDYISDNVEYLVVATLPEDTEAMDIGSVVEKTTAPTV